MADQLSPALVQLLRERAQNPARRSGSAALAARSVSVDEAMAGLDPDPAWSDDVRREVGQYVAGVNSPFAGLMADLTSGGGQARDLLGALGSLTGGGPLFAMSGDLGVVSLGTASTPAPAPPPATGEDVRAVEAALGFELPTQLRQFYLEVADGGVGPGDGLYSLAELVAKHRELTAEPVGPQGQPWPAGLVPVQGDHWDLVCLDRDTGGLVFWDLEELDDDDELPPDQPTWAASFVPEAESLEAWLGAWTASPA